MGKKKRAKKSVPQQQPVEKPKSDAPVPAFGGRVFSSNFTVRFSTDGRLYVNRSPSTEPKDAPSLRDAVADQVAALTVDLAGPDGPELPAPERDLTTYADAFASAAKKCDHRDAIETLYGREWVCDTCHRVLDREAMRKARGGGGIWGMFE
jgi:hypothetical protein